MSFENKIKKCNIADEFQLPDMRSESLFVEHQHQQQQKYSELQILKDLDEPFKHKLAQLDQWWPKELEKYSFKIYQIKL